MLWRIREETQEEVFISACEQIAGCVQKKTKMVFDSNLEELAGQLRRPRVRRDFQREKGMPGDLLEGLGALPVD